MGSMKVNSNSIMSPKNNAKAVSQPRGYAGANGSLGLTKSQVAAYHATKGLGTPVKSKTKSAPSPVATTASKNAGLGSGTKYPAKKLRQVGVASPSRTLRRP